MDDALKNFFLALVRLGIGHEGVAVQEQIDWNAIDSLAAAQGLSAILVDGIERITGMSRPPKELLLQWIGSVMQGYEQRYELYQRAISELACFYNSHGFRMMVLKGYACSMNWPKPEHRPCGDIDIWQFGCYKEADAQLASEKGIKIDSSHHHHTVFYWRGFMVENHYDFINIHHHKSNVDFEMLLKELGNDDGYSIGIKGERVYLPSPQLHSLFLLKHAAIEFAASGMNLRQVLDWAFFVQANGKDVDWDRIENVLERFGMKRFYNIINAICVDNLGFNASMFPAIHYDEAMKERVLNEILSPEIPNAKPIMLLARVIWKLRRWKGNAWKHRLCYNESMWSAFWSGMWSHILKPSSI